MRILFYDVATPSAYDYASLSTRALGGTEATVIRVAHGLSGDCSVYVAQHCRTRDLDTKDNNVHYISFATAKWLHEKLSFDIVVLMRDPKFLEATALTFPHTKLYFWMHNTPSKNLYQYAEILKKYEFQIIAVSQYLKKLIRKRLKGKWYHRLTRKNYIIPIHVLYNPIDANLLPNTTPWDPKKLIFLSSPQKGLLDTIAMYKKVLQQFPDYVLYVANPGHRKLPANLPSQIKILGSLPHHEIIQHLRESFCVFYPQYKKAETFGLIYAEANAVGTPVLAHEFGAAKEVLSTSDQLTNARSLSNIIKKLGKWQISRPIVHAKEDFRIQNVIRSWKCLFIQTSKDGNYE